MKNICWFFVTLGIFPAHLYAFHKESYYGDPYSMEYVGKYSTVNLTKEDILFADYIVEMLRNTSYSTIDFNASITYPSRFRHLYETGVQTETTRRFATTSTKSPTTEKNFWEFPQDGQFFDITNLWDTPSSITFHFGTVGTRSSTPRLQEKSDSSLLLNKIENIHSKTKSVASLCTKMSEDRLANVQDIITRKIMTQVVEARKTLATHHSSDFTTTRKRRSLPWHLQSDSGPWITSKEQEQMWALRGTSLLDSEKYDFPFPYDFDKWPGCTTKDLLDPKNTVQILQYENGHVRFIGVSKPGWNEFPWKPTEFTTAFPAYQRLDRYLTYLSRPWYGYYSTLVPTMSKVWNKKTTQAWSRYTFANRSWKSKYGKENIVRSRKWIIDRWPPDWNRTIHPQSSATTWKRTWWGGIWHLPTRKPSPNATASTLKVDFSRTKTLTPDQHTTKRIYVETKNPDFPHKPISTISSASKSTRPGFGFLSISPTWYAYQNNLSNTSWYSNATWLSEWSRLWYEASSKSGSWTLRKGKWNSTSNLSYLELCNKEFSLPVYTYSKIPISNQWTEDWLFQWKKNTSFTSSRISYTKPIQSPNYRNGEYLNEGITVKPRELSTLSKQYRGGWTLPALTKMLTKSDTLGKFLYPSRTMWQHQPTQWRGGWSNTWNKQVAPSGKFFHPQSDQRYPNQWNTQGYPINTEKQQKWSPWSQQYRGLQQTWINQWNKQQPLPWSRTCYTKPYQQLHSKQWGEGSTWNRKAPLPENRAFYMTTKPYQQYPNQWNRDGSLTWSRMWNTKLYHPNPNQRNIGGNFNQRQVEQPREWKPWSTQRAGGWSQTWTKQSPPRS